MSHKVEISDGVWLRIAYQIYSWLEDVPLNDVPIYTKHHTIILDFKKEEHSLEFVLTWL